MRHWIGLGLAIILALALFFGGGWAVTQMSALPAEGLGLTSNRGLAALGALAALGLLLGILMAAPRISPLAAGLVGVALLAWTALLGLSSTQAVRLIPMGNEPSGAGFHELLGSGVLALLGVAMIFPLFVPSRWWRGDDGEDDGGGDSGDDDDDGDDPRRRRRRRRRPPRPPAPTGLLSG
jgi:hypothetical protein